MARACRAGRAAPGHPAGRAGLRVEHLRRQVLHTVQVGEGDYRSALLRLRYLAARYGPPEVAALAQPEELRQPPVRRQD